MSTGYLALIIFVVIIAQVGLIMMFGLYHRRRKLKDKTSETACITENADRLDDVLLYEDTGWKGFREFIVIRREIVTHCLIATIPIITEYLSNGSSRQSISQSFLLEFHPTIFMIMWKKACVCRFVHPLDTSI